MIKSLTISIIICAGLAFTNPEKKEFVQFLNKQIVKPIDEKSPELSKEIKILDPESMRPNATHRITVTASSASVPEAKKYTGVIFVPPQWGDVWVYFEDRESIRCKFWEFKGY